MLTANTSFNRKPKASERVAGTSLARIIHHGKHGNARKESRVRSWMDESQLAPQAVCNSALCCNSFPSVSFRTTNVLFLRRARRISADQIRQNDEAQNHPAGRSACGPLPSFCASSFCRPVLAALGCGYPAPGNPWFLMNNPGQPHCRPRRWLAVKRRLAFFHYFSSTGLRNPSSNCSADVCSFQASKSSSDRATTLAFIL